MPLDRSSTAPRTPAPPALAAHLLGLIDFDACLALQHRLVYEAAGRVDGQITLLVCEHPLAITIGRLGSRGHVRARRGELASHELEPRWVNRGGGCLVHAPGQLAIYPIVPLEWRGWTVGEYLGRLQAGLAAAVGDAGFAASTRPGRFGLWGHTGQIAAVTVAVKSWIAYFGAYLNVAPALFPQRWVESDPLDGGSMSTLAAERRKPVRMAAVREAVVRRLADALACDRYHLYSGHPLLARPRDASPARPARVG